MVVNKTCLLAPCFQSSSDLKMYNSIIKYTLKSRGKKATFPKKGKLSNLIEID